MAGLITTAFVHRRLFLLLWGLPVRIQVGVPLATIRRALPGFEARVPELRRAQPILDSIERWAADGKREPDELDMTGFDTSLHEIADRSVISAVSTLAELYPLESTPETLTSACTLATVDAIDATVASVWNDEDPRAAAARRSYMDARDTGGSYSGPWPPPDWYDCAAARIQLSRGWQDVLARLQSLDVHGFPDVEDRDELARAYRRWKRFPMVLYPWQTRRALA
jgi:hypothetical protein